MTECAPLRVGLLGCGRIARKFHLPILAALPGVELVALAEPEAAAAAACRFVAPRARRFARHEELLDAGGIDAVVVCLPPALHAEAAVAAFERRLHVYVEKPLATSLAEAERVVASWRRAGRAGMIGFNYRFHPLVGEMRRALGRGELGPVVSARSSFGAARRELPAWKRERDSGGGVLLDLASHHFDLARFLLDAEFVEVSALARSVRSEQDTAAVAARLSSGPLVTISVSLAGAEDDRFEVTGERGALRFDRYRSSRLEALSAQRDFRPSARLRGALRGFGALRDALVPPRDTTFRRALAAFAAAARGEGPATPDLADGAASLAAVLAAERAAREGRSVTL